MYTGIHYFLTAGDPDKHTSPLSGRLRFNFELRIIVFVSKLERLQPSACFFWYDMALPSRHGSLLVGKHCYGWIDIDR